MTPDWTVLAPHRPTGLGEKAYVKPPGISGKDIADRIIAGQPTILVGGPAGIGKSTELGSATARLRGKGRRVACFVPVDQWENMRRLTPDQLLLRIATTLGQLVQHLELPVDPMLLNQVEAALGPVMFIGSEPRAVFGHMTGSALARALIDEVVRLASPRRITLLIDGMEKVQEGPESSELFEAIGALPAEVELVVVMPWHAAYGPHTDAIVRPGEHWEILSPPAVEGPSSPGTGFLKEIIAHRLGFDAKWLQPLPVGSRAAAHIKGEPSPPPSSFAEIAEQAAEWSGGLPRTFLQLIAGAGTYARLHRKVDWPSNDDLGDAIADLEDSFRRSLLRGDTEACVAAVGTDGREMELGRKIRLLARGILLERKDGRRSVFEVHPLARAAVLDGTTHA